MVHLRVPQHTGVCDPAQFAVGAHHLTYRRNLEIRLTEDQHSPPWLCSTVSDGSWSLGCDLRGQRTNLSQKLNALHWLCSTVGSKSWNMCSNCVACRQSLSSNRH